MRFSRFHVASSHVVSESFELADAGCALIPSSWICLLVSVAASWGWAGCSFSFSNFFLPPKQLALTVFNIPMKNIHLPTSLHAKDRFSRPAKSNMHLWHDRISTLLECLFFPWLMMHLPLFASGLSFVGKIVLLGGRIKHWNVNLTWFVNQKGLEEKGNFR